jgi:hypothetical protein
MKRSVGLAGLTAVAALLAACSHHGSAPPPDLMDRSRDIFLLLRYDANNDRQVTRAEMEAGLKAQYAAADTNHDGKLTSDEVQAENQRRWSQEGPQSSPLMDWNQDGNVDFEEFSGAVHSLFIAVDRNKDDVVTVKELQSPRAVAPPPKLNPNEDTQPTQGPGGGY